MGFSLFHCHISSFFFFRDFPSVVSYSRLHFHSAGVLGLSPALSLLSCGLDDERQLTALSATTFGNHDNKGKAKEEKKKRWIGVNGMEVGDMEFLFLNLPYSIHHSVHASH